MLEDSRGPSVSVKCHIIYRCLSTADYTPPWPPTTSVCAEHPISENTCLAVEKAADRLVPGIVPQIYVPLGMPRVRVRYLSPMPVSFFVRSNLKPSQLPADWDENGLGIRTIPTMHNLQAEPQTPTVGRGWECFVHPEGQLYFRFKHFYTNACLHDDAILEDIEDAVDLLQSHPRLHPHHLPEDIDICLDIYVDVNGDKLACYYICNLEAQEMLWLTDVPVTYLIEDENLQVYDEEHLKHAHRQAYWAHLRMFPHARTVSERELKALRGILNYQLYNRKTSASLSTTLFYKSDDLYQFAQIVKDIRSKGSYYLSEHDMVVVAQIELLISAQRLVSYYGTRWAGLDPRRSQREDGTTERSRRSWWFMLVSSITFYAPTVYIKHFDGVIMAQAGATGAQSLWRTLMKELQDDWAASITPSTVILSANVGFLAIQSVDQGGFSIPDRSAGQIISYISILLSICNIMACTILSRQHRPTFYLAASEELVPQRDRPFRRVTSPWRAELTAIMLSIPTAFFIWSLLLFSAAILWVCFQGTSTATRGSVATVASFCVSLLVLLALAGQDTQPTTAGAAGWLPTRPLHHLAAAIRRAFSKPKVRMDSEVGIRRVRVRELNGDA
ncbi:hypothetical protein C8Q78DRAFT_997815 [Trametes maxima]|nr:hypothetical protein C8Q78DRAFT_997815 [Trametes maxima]